MAFGDKALGETLRQLPGDKGQKVRWSQPFPDFGENSSEFHEILRNFIENLKACRNLLKFANFLEFSSPEI